MVAALFRLTGVLGRLSRVLLVFYFVILRDHASPSQSMHEHAVERHQFTSLH